MLLFGLCLGAHAARAQSPAPQLPPQTADPQPGFYKDVPDTYIEEAKRYHQYCDATPTLNFYYNCDCLEVAYLDKRIKDGPLPSQSSISLSITKKCQDASNAAGFEYMNCMQGGQLLPDKADPEKFCSCFARNYAQLFEKSKMQANSKNFVALKTRAFVFCQNPALARETYPDLSAP